MACVDPDALGGLYDRHGWMVRGIVLGALPDAERVDEIVQAVFVQAWREAEIYDVRAGTPMAWLCTMARQRTLGRLSKRARARGPTTPTPRASSNGAREGHRAADVALVGP
jgi:RNA polymerase sigma-70 factor, ECF subfamily